MEQAQLELSLRLRTHLRVSGTFIRKSALGAQISKKSAKSFTFRFHTTSNNNFYMGKYFVNTMAFHLRHITYNIDRSWLWILIRSHITRVCAIRTLTIIIFQLFSDCCCQNKFQFSLTFESLAYHVETNPYHSQQRRGTPNIFRNYLNCILIAPCSWRHLLVSFTPLLH